MEGRVYATDISDIFMDHLRNVIDKESLVNVVPELVHSSQKKFKNIPDRSVDLALICDVYHHFEYPRTAMRGKCYF